MNPFTRFTKGKARSEGTLQAALPFKSNTRR